MANKSLWSVNSAHSSPSSASTVVTSKNSGQVTVNAEFCQALDFAMRNLSQSNDMMVKGVLDQNRTLNDTIKLMTDQLREMTLVNKDLASTNGVLIDELKTLRKETDDLKVEKTVVKSETPCLRQEPAQISHGQFMQQNQSNFNTLFAPQQHGAFQSFLQTQNMIPSYQQMPIGYPHAGNQYDLMVHDQQSLNQLAQNYLSIIGLQQQPQQQVTSAFQPQVHSQGPLLHHLPSATSTIETQASFKPSGVSSQSKEARSTTKTASAPSSKPLSGPLISNSQQQQTSVSTNTTSNIFKQAASTSKTSTQPFAPVATQKQPTFAEMAAAAAAAATSKTVVTTTAKTSAPSNVFASLSLAKSPNTTPAASVTSTPVSSTAASGKGLFGASSIFAPSDSSNSSFAQLSQKAAASTDEKKPTTSNTFFGAGRPVFGAATQKSPTETRDKDDTGDDNEDQENFEPTVEFKPLVPLPALVQVQTGEEGEEILFKERAKLFRFDSNTKEFKERGTGELKLLKNKDTNRTRLLMRRDQTLKLCANHLLNDAMKLLLLAKSDKAFTWQCQDFSENELKPETLAVRFKNAEMAQNFKKFFEKAASESSADTDKRET